MHKDALTARVSSKGQIALPKPIRDQVGFSEGSDLSIRIEGQEVILRKVSRDWRRWKGYFRGSNLLADLAAERQKELAHDAESI